MTCTGVHTYIKFYRQLCVELHWGKKSNYEDNIFLICFKCHYWSAVDYRLYIKKPVEQHLVISESLLTSMRNGLEVVWGNLDFFTSVSGIPDEVNNFYIYSMLGKISPDCYILDLQPFFKRDWNICKFFEAVKWSLKTICISFLQRRGCLQEVHTMLIQNLSSRSLETHQNRKILTKPRK